MPKPAPTCPKCGSTNICKDAAARWDADAGEWTLASVHDSETCDDCGAEGDWLTDDGFAISDA